MKRQVNKMAGTMRKTPPWSKGKSGKPGKTFCTADEICIQRLPVAVYFGFCPDPDRSYRKCTGYDVYQKSDR